MSHTHARLGGFIAISIILHLLTVLGIGPLDLSARRSSSVSLVELHATLAPDERAQAGPKHSPAGNEAEPVRDAGPEISRSGRPAAAEAPGASESGLALPAPDKWYTAREVDVRAEPLTVVELRYPEELLRRAVIGRVQLRLFIDERGVIRKMQIDASEPGGVFDGTAKQTWEDVKFSPAIKNGAPVKSQKVLELVYQPGLI